MSGSTDCNHSVDWRILAMFHTPSGRCLVALCFVLRWSATVATRLSSAATNLEPEEQEIKPSFADADSYHTCELSEGLYTMSNLSEIQCASDKRLKDIIEMNPNSSSKFVLKPEVPVRLVGKGEELTKLEFDVSLSPGASLYLEALHLEGQIEVIENETSIGESKMSCLTFVKCHVTPPAQDAKQLALANLEISGLQDPSASAWWGWLMVRDAALSLQIHGSHLHGGAFVEQSTNFNLFASKTSFHLEGQGFQLVNVTSHIQLEEVVVWNFCRISGHPSFQMLSGRPEVHVTGSTFFGSAIEIKEPADLILDVGKTRFKRGGQRAIVVTGYEGNSSQVDLQDVNIRGFSDVGVRASDFQSAMGLWRFIWWSAHPGFDRPVDRPGRCEAWQYPDFKRRGWGKNKSKASRRQEHGHLANPNRDRLDGWRSWAGSCQDGTRWDRARCIEYKKTQSQRPGNLGGKESYSFLLCRQSIPGHWGVHFELFSGCGLPSLWFFVNGWCPHSRKCPSSQLRWRHNGSDLKSPGLLQFMAGHLGHQSGQRS